jgi:hypothetical protein
MAFGKGAFGRVGPDDTASARYYIDMCISSRQRLIQEYFMYIRTTHKTDGIERASKITSGDVYEYLHIGASRNVN